MVAGCLCQGQAADSCGLSRFHAEQNCPAVCLIYLENSRGTRRLQSQNLLDFWRVGCRREFVPGRVSADPSFRTTTKLSGIYVKVWCMGVWIWCSSPIPCEPTLLGRVIDERFHQCPAAGSVLVVKTLAGGDDAAGAVSIFDECRPVRVGQAVRGFGRERKRV